MRLQDINITESLPSQEKISHEIKNEIGEAALAKFNLLKTPEQFELMDLDIRIAGELMLGLESEKIKNLTKKGYDKFLTDQEIDELLTVSNLVQGIMNQNDADLAIDELVAEQFNLDHDVFIIEDFYDFRKKMSTRHRQFKQGFSSDQEYEVALANLPYQSSYDKRQQLKNCTTSWLIGFNRQIQELLSRPDELATLSEVTEYISSASALIHIPEDRDKNGQLVFLNKDNFEFNQKKIETSLIGAINENCFRQLFELTDLGQAIEYYSSTPEEDLKGIDCHLNVKYTVDEYGRYHLATAEQLQTGQYQQILVPIDIKASEKLAEECLNKKRSWAERKGVTISGYPIFSGVHREDLSLYQDPKTGLIEVSSVHDMKTCLSPELMAVMMKSLPNHIYYGNGYRPANFSDRLDKVKADILRAVKHYDQQAKAQKLSV